MHSKPGFTYNDNLVKELTNLTFKYDEINRDPKIKLDQIEFTDEEVKMRDFFMVLAICNTVVATKKNAHLDVIDDDGQIITEQEPDESSSNNNPNNVLSAKFNFFKIFGSYSPASNNTTSSYKRRPIYESESPDEVALVLMSFNYKYRLCKRGKDFVEVELPNGKKVSYEVLNLLPFDSNRKRMSIIVKCPFTKKLILYCKGSDLTVLSKLTKDYASEQIKMKELSMTYQNLKRYSTKGFRVLCMAKRILSKDLYEKWLKQYDEAEKFGSRRLILCMDDIESDMTLLGATAIEDRLQFRVPEVISSLKAAGIVIWVLTGDKMETAINIAKSCELFHSDMKLIELALPAVKSKVTLKSGFSIWL